MRLVLITGMSGAGKSATIQIMEDLGYYCMDNLPPPLIPKCIELCGQAGNLTRLAIVVDIRGGDFFTEATRVLDEPVLRQNGYELLYLDASDAALVKRFKETRRTHPLDTKAGGLLSAIRMERALLEELKARAARIIDTSCIPLKQLKTVLEHEYGSDAPNAGFRVLMTSFGFKYGLPSDVDMVLDVRFLPNPFYQQHLRPYTGLHPDVREYVFSHEIAPQFVDKTVDMLIGLFPHYVNEGKRSLAVAVGCTGGMHRSVAIAQAMGERLAAQGYAVSFDHRDAELEQGRVIR